MFRIRWNWEGAALPWKSLSYDPQTSGGLLASVKMEDAPEALKELKELGLPCAIVGRIEERQERPLL